jgi:hypothetical protein
LDTCRKSKDSFSLTRRLQCTGLTISFAYSRNEQWFDQPIISSSLYLPLLCTFRLQTNEIKSLSNQNSQTKRAGFWLLKMIKFNRDQPKRPKLVSRPHRTTTPCTSPIQQTLHSSLPFSFVLEAFLSFIPTSFSFSRQSFAPSSSLSLIQIQSLLYFLSLQPSPSSLALTRQNASPHCARRFRVFPRSLCIRSKPSRRLCPRSRLHPPSRQRRHRVLDPRRRRRRHPDLAVRCRQQPRDWRPDRQ